MANQTEPAALHLLAGKALSALDDSDASQAEKLAALRVAIATIEQAIIAQSMAQSLADAKSGKQRNGDGSPR